MHLLHKNVSWQVLVLVGILMFPLGKFFIMHYQFSPEVAYLFYYSSGLFIGMALADLVSKMGQVMSGNGRRARK